jgi:hypothetical protein
VSGVASLFILRRIAKRHVRNFSVVCFMHQCLKLLCRHRMTDNVLQLGEVADLEAQKFNFALMFIRNPNVQFSTKPAILPNCCYRFGVLSFGLVLCVGKDILIDKFWLLRLAFVRLGNVYGFWGGNIY